MLLAGRRRTPSPRIHRILHRRTPPPPGCPGQPTRLPQRRWGATRGAATTTSRETCAGENSSPTRSSSFASTGRGKSTGPKARTIPTVSGCSPLFSRQTGGFTQQLTSKQTCSGSASAQSSVEPRSAESQARRSGPVDTPLLLPVQGTLFKEEARALARYKTCSCCRNQLSPIQSRKVQRYRSSVRLFIFQLKTSGSSPALPAPQNSCLTSGHAAGS